MKIFFKLLHLLKRGFLSPEKYAKSLGAKIGKGCMISSKHFTSESYLITIGNYVRIAKNVRFFTHGGLWSQRFNHPDLFLEQFGKIVIGDYSYLGDSCMIMPGVIIGANCVVGSGSVVTKSIPDGMMVAGNPAKIIGKTEDMVLRVASKSPVRSMDFYKYSLRERENFIKSLPDNQFVHKKLMTV